jgi:hypothetical protein
MVGVRARLRALSRVLGRAARSTNKFGGAKGLVDVR